VYIVILKTNVNGTVHSDVGKGNFVMLSKISASSFQSVGFMCISCNQLRDIGQCNYSEVKKQI
jgi:hypothetical protein